MPIFRLTRKLVFPPPELADPQGILAVGGDLQVGRLMLAYRNGIFPWYSAGDPIIWWSPDPRFVLFPEKLRVSHSMRQVLNSQRFRATVDHDFRSVIEHCGKTKRKAQDGTWITADMVEAYCRLHKAGHAHSVEVWEGDQLAGGLYGVAVGGVFCGESMFTRVPNASKFALIHLVRTLIPLGVELIDSQVRTDHLARLGAEEIPRTDYLERLYALRDRTVPQGSWGEKRG